MGCGSSVAPATDTIEPAEKQLNLVDDGQTGAPEIQAPPAEKHTDALPDDHLNNELSEHKEQILQLKLLVAEQAQQRSRNDTAADFENEMRTTVRELQLELEATKQQLDEHKRAVATTRASTMRASSHERVEDQARIAFAVHSHYKASAIADTHPNTQRNRSEAARDAWDALLQQEIVMAVEFDRPFFVPLIKQALESGAGVLSQVHNQTIQTAFDAVR